MKLKVIICFCSFSIFILPIENTVHADTVHFRKLFRSMAAGYGDILVRGTDMQGILIVIKMEQPVRF